MTDVLGMALQHRDELHAEIVRLEDFIRTARDLMQRAPAEVRRPDPAMPAPLPEPRSELPKPWLQHDARQ